MGFGFLRVVKMSTIVGKRFLYIGRQHGKKAISTRVSPYIIDMLNNPVISYDHIHNICNMMAETELLAGVIRFMSIIISIKRFI